jgi:hypothetical protein
MTVNFRLSVEQYRDFCRGFFLGLPSAAALEKEISSMNHDDFEQWRNRLFASYIQYRDPVKELVQIIRGDYHPERDRDNSDKHDPLKQPENQEFKQQYEDVFNGTLDEFFADVPSYKLKGEELLAVKAAEHNLKRLNIVVKGTPFCALRLVDAADADDSPVWVVEHNGSKRLVASQSGVLNFVDRDYLTQRIAGYKDAICSSEEILSMLG